MRDAMTSPVVRQIFKRGHGTGRSRASVGQERSADGGDPASNWKPARNPQGGRRLNARDDDAAAGILTVAEEDRGLRAERRGPRVVASG